MFILAIRVSTSSM